MPQPLPARLKTAAFAVLRASFAFAVFAGVLLFGAWVAGLAL